VVLYGCETCSLTLREEHRQRAFESVEGELSSTRKVAAGVPQVSVLAPVLLRRIFEPKRDEVTGGWRKLHNEELHNLYSSPSKIRMIKSRRTRWAGHVARMGRR
jgi:hypothetical protein